MAGKDEELLNPVLSFEGADPNQGNFRFDRDLPPGWYTAVVKKVKVKSSKAGNPMIVLLLCVEGGPEGAVAIMHYIPVKPCGFRTTLFEALGYLRADTSKEQVDVREWVGLECQIKSKYEDDLDGKARPKIADMKPVKGPNEQSRRHPAKGGPREEYDTKDVEFGE
jgi:hypothetical protein